MKIRKVKINKGSILIIALLILGVMLFLSSYFIAFSLTGSRMSQSHEVATKTYYLAEAGINQAIWKLKNDDIWSTCFVTSSFSYGCDCTNATWTDSFTTSTNALIPNSTITVNIVSSECGRGKIITTSTIDLGGGKFSQRVVKTTVLKALASPTNDATMFSGSHGENILITDSNIRVYGNISCNKKLDIKGESRVEVYATGTAEGKVLVVKNLDGEEKVTAVAKCAANICKTTSTCACTDPEDFQECINSYQCRPWPATIPEVDFDEGSNSFRSRASSTEALGQCNNSCNGGTCLCNGSSCPGNNKCVLDDDEFDDLLWAAGEGGTLTLGTSILPTITYVTGPINLGGNRHLVVNGVLVADGTIDVGTNEGDFQLTINRPTDTTASGLLARGDIRFGEYLASTPTTITGVVYTMDRIIVENMPGSFTVRGGIIGRMVKFTGVSEWFNLFLDNEVIRYGLGYYDVGGNPVQPQYSPIVIVEHWEESY